MESTQEAKEIGYRILEKLTLSGHFKSKQHRKNFKAKIKKRVQVRFQWLFSAIIFVPLLHSDIMEISSYFRHTLTKATLMKKSL